jgi:hypothetical protein
MIKETMRKLAREAVIFTLFGLLIGIIGVFVAMDIDDRAAAKEKAAQAVHGSTVTQMQVTVDFNKAPAQSVTDTVLVPLRNGTVLLVRRCAGPIPVPPGATVGEPEPASLDELRAAVEAPSPPNCRNFSFSGSDPHAYYLGDSLSLAVPLGDADQVAIEKDYWAAYKNSRHQHLAGEMLGSLFLGGLYGSPAGLGLWIFYRLVRFAIKG